MKNSPTIPPPVAPGAPPLLEHLNDLLIESRFRGMLEANGLDSLSALFSVEGGDRLDKAGLPTWRRRIRIRTTFEGVEQTLYLKWFLRPPMRARWFAGRRASRRKQATADPSDCVAGRKHPAPMSLAGTEWSWLSRLARAGIPCPQRVALGEVFDGRRERRSAMLMLAVPGDALERWLERWIELEPRRVRALVDGTADLIARLHGAGFIHRDLYLSHVFFDAEAAAPDHTLHLIDVQRVIEPKWLRGRWLVKDLASLNYSTPRKWVTSADRVRWLRRYLGVGRLGRRGKQLARRIVRKTGRIARHDQRRAARLAGC